MNPLQPTIADEIARYLNTGDTDILYTAWPGDFLHKARRARLELRTALVQEVRRRTEGRSHQPVLQSDPLQLTRRKVKPMVRGLFPRAEQDAVLTTLERSVVFLTADRIEQVITEQSWDSSAWTLANVYLLALEAPLLAETAPRIVGMSEETTCYVSPLYFVDDDPFADFVVHEAAHVFHNCKRHTMGLKETRRREWPLDIDYRKREAFAYSCEAFSWIIEHSANASERRALADRYAREITITAQGVDSNEVANVIQAAASARNGWKVILAAFQPEKRPAGRTLNLQPA